VVNLPNGNQLRGSYGNLYYQLSRASENGLTGGAAQIVDGSVVSICNSTYFNDLNLIGSLSSSNANRNSIKMQCLPDLNEIQVVSSQAIDYYVDTASKTIIFQNLPMGVDIDVSWRCPNTI
jgi:hypothetical protein